MPSSSLQQRKKALITHKTILDEPYTCRITDRNNTKQAHFLAIEQKQRLGQIKKQRLATTLNRQELEQRQSENKDLNKSQNKDLNKNGYYEQRK